MKKEIFAITASFLLAAPAHAQEMSKAEWTRYMAESFPAVICQDDLYFRQCFTISAGECREIAREAIMYCSNKEQKNLPEMLRASDGEQWATILGSCAGGIFEKKLIARKSNDPKCYNSSYWLQ